MSNNNPNNPAPGVSGVNNPPSGSQHHQPINNRQHNYPQVPRNRNRNPQYRPRFDLNIRDQASQDSANFNQFMINRNAPQMYQQIGSPNPNSNNPRPRGNQQVQQPDVGAIQENVARMVIEPQVVNVPVNQDDIDDTEVFNQLIQASNPIPNIPARRILTDEERLAWLGAANNLNRYDTLRTLQAAFPALNVCADLIFRNIGLGIFVNDANTNYLVLSYIINLTNMGKVRTLGLPPALLHSLNSCEMVAPVIPEDRFLNQAQSRRAFLKYSSNYFFRYKLANKAFKVKQDVLEQMDEIDPELYDLVANGAQSVNQIYIAIRNLAIPQGQQNQNQAGGNLPAGNDVDDEANQADPRQRDGNDDRERQREEDNIENEIVINIDTIPDVEITAMAEALIGQILLYTVAVEMKPSILTHNYLITYVSLAKRGQITETKVEALNAQFTEELGFDVSLNSDVIKATYNSLKALITQDNAHQVFGSLAERLTDFSLRAKLILQQAAGSGLTSYISIINAIKIFPDFPWDKVCKLYPTEITNFGEALTEVGGNQYFGFGSDLRTARSTRFKNLAYVAIYLLVNHRAQEFGSLKKYAGIPRMPDKAPIIMEILEGYEPDAELADIPANAPEVFRTARDIIIN